MKIKSFLSILPHQLSLAVILCTLVDVDNMINANQWHDHELESDISWRGRLLLISHIGLWILCTYVCVPFPALSQYHCWRINREPSQRCQANTSVSQFVCLSTNHSTKHSVCQTNYRPPDLSLLYNIICKFKQICVCVSVEGKRMKIGVFVRVCVRT